MVLKNLLIGQQWRNRHREQTYGHGVKGGEGEMYAKRNMETYIIICGMDGQWEFAIWLGNSNSGFVSTWRHRMWGKVGGEVQWGGDICVPMADSG